MRISSITLVLLLAACGTKKNPEACCVDEADCASIGLPVGSNCDDGMLCRGHRCVEVSCDVSAQCDLSAPYCIGAPDGVCQQSCAMDMECPGFGQSTEQKFCEAGSCVACRAAMNDCTTGELICDMGECRRCEQHAECGSGVCNADGTCALETDIAFVAPLGSTSSACTRTDPCTLARSFQPGLVERPFALLDTGAYQLAGTLTVASRRTLVGKGTVRPTVTSTMQGAIFKIALGADFTIDNVEVTGAMSTASPGSDGYGIECPDFIQGKVHIVRSAITQSFGGVIARHCTLDVIDSTFSGNGVGVESYDTTANVTRSMFVNNTGLGLQLDAGLYTVTNSFFVRNGKGVELFPTTAGSIFEFNTIADNQMTGLMCDAIQGLQYNASNSLIVRNGTNTASTSGTCVFSSSMVTNDVAAVKFKNASTVPYDYHLTAGSIAIDQISASSQAKDFDGESRPFGAGHDYGADELH